MLRINKISKLAKWMFSLSVLLPFTSYSLESTKTDRLFVFFDAGETNALLPVLKKLEADKKDFQVLVMATAETIITPEMFTHHRLVLKDLGITENVDNKTARTIGLSEISLKAFDQILPRTVIVGGASKIQQQVLEKYPCATTFVYLDSFNYNPSDESFKTVEKIEAVAKQVLSPSKNVATVLDKIDPSTAKHKYVVVGKPTLETWKSEITQTDKSKTLQALGFTEGKGSIIMFIGGYGPGYEVVNPLFDSCAQDLRQKGYQVFIQPHPKIAAQKVKTTEGLAIADYVVGYNSTVVLDAALVGKNSLFMIPPAAPYEHFAMQQHLISKVDSCEQLLDYIKQNKKPNDVAKAIALPSDSVQTISKLIDNGILNSTCQY